MKDELEKRLVKGKIALIREQPFFGRLCTLLELQENEFCPTAGTDGEYLYYNPEFIKSLSDQELLFVLGHETLHCALGHVWRREKRHPHPWNLACDYASNIILGKNDFLVPNWALYDQKYSDMSAEMIYDKIPKLKLKCTICGGEIQEDGEQQEGEQSGEGGGESKEDENKKNKEGKGGGDKDKDKKEKKGKEGKDVSKMSKEDRACQGHSFWGKKKGNKKDKQTQKKFEKLAKRWAAAVVEEASKQRGDVPAGMERIIKQEQEREDWRQIFASYLSTSVTDFNFLKRDRRTFDWDFYFPDMEDETQLENVVVAVDTSGSIDDRTMNKFMAEVKAIVKTFPRIKGWFMACDCKVSQFESLEEVSKIKSTYGYGGTSHIPVIDELSKRKIIPKVLVCFTDLYTEFPRKKPDYPVLWLLTPDGSNEKPPFGRVIKMRKNGNGY